MGSCCCCAEPDGAEVGLGTSSRRDRNNLFSRHSASGVRPSSGKQLQGEIRVCANCGAEVDATLLDGHKEVCKANHLREVLAKNAALLSHAGLQPLPSSSNLRDDTMSLGEKELCLVCMDRPRCYAFLPCGHICCCPECTKSLDQCPLCREPREGLCHVSPNVTAQYECKHCHEFIAPTLFDGHREVCSLRQRQKQQDAEAAAAASASPDAPATAGDGALGIAGKEAGRKNTSSASPARNSPCTVDAGGEEASEVIAGKIRPSPPSQTLGNGVARVQMTGRSRSHVCLECGKVYDLLVVCAPCGHRVLCYNCAHTRATCPVCLSEIRDTIVVFD